jgi:glycine cleavage system aminomethyltransferase T
MIPASRAGDVWAALVAAGVRPCGLGARDTLRLEAGMNLYGQDMDETVNPLESGLAWTVDLQSARDFVGKAALVGLLARDGVRRRLIGLVLDRQRRRAARHQLVHSTLWRRRDHQRPHSSPTLTGRLRSPGCRRMWRRTMPCRSSFATRNSRRES